MATLADRLAPRGERFTKSLIFVPMAISFVGAATIWRFVYESRPEGQPQIGILNAIGTKLGFEPVAFIQKSDLRLNTLLLMVVLIWLQVGFAMVLLSAAIKSVPGEVIEASRVDGATERQIFFRVLLPQIWPTVVTVLVITMILVLKVFDVVYVMTGGQFKTDVIGNRFVIELFQFGNEGRAAAIVVILLLAVVPAMIYQVRQFRAQEARMSTQQAPLDVPVVTASRSRAALGAGCSAPAPSRATRRGPCGSSLFVICVLWMIPALGLLVTSVRNEDDASTSGWWTADLQPVRHDLDALATTTRC